MLKELLVAITPLSMIQKIENSLLKNYNLSKYLLSRENPSLIEKISEKKVMAIFHKANTRIPAYKNFLKEHKINPKEIKSIGDFNVVLPQTTKENYVKKNKDEDLCIDGELPKTGIIEESSGSTGKPTNWIKDFHEDRLLDLEVGFEGEYLFGIRRKRYIIISCWAFGPWTTDLKFCEFFEHYGLVKNVGPNPEGVIELIKKYGPKYNYLIGGYPPFCKTLFEGGGKKISWKRYKIDVLTGGEGFVIGWRERMKQLLGENATIISAYGASDIDIGIAFETPLSILIRELCFKNKEVKKIISDNELYPMVFQYNPLAHYITNEKENNEFTITPLDDCVSAPKVKYNLHDGGKKISFNEMIEQVNKVSNNALNEYVMRNKDEILHFPFLIVSGRTDGTISINGTNIYPSQIEMALMKDKTSFHLLNSFMISAQNTSKTRFTVKIELNKGIKITKNLKKIYEGIVMKNLPKISEEYAQAKEDFKEAMTPFVEVYAYCEGPFKKDKKRIKHKYIQ